MALVCVTDSRWSPRSVVVERQTSVAVVAGRMMFTSADKTPWPAITRAVDTDIVVSRVLDLNSHALARVPIAFTPAQSSPFTT